MPPGQDVEIGTLSVQVIAARNLKGRDSGGYLSSLLGSNNVNPFCRIRLERHVQDSETAHNTLNPQWRRNLLFFPVEVPEGCIGGGPTADGAAGVSRRGSHDSGSEGPSVVKPGNVLKPSAPLRRQLILKFEVLHRHDEGDGVPDKLGGEVLPPLGETELDLVDLLTGRADRIDVWLPLDPPGGHTSKGNTAAGDLRVVVDFDASARLPKVGDTVRLIRLGHALDFYPLDAAKELVVEDNAMDDGVLVSYTTPEGWRCAAEVHRVLVIPIDRPEPWSVDGTVRAAVGAAKAVAASPAAEAAKAAVEKVANEGISGATAVVGEAWDGAQFVAWRWLGGGLTLAANDVLTAAGFSDVAEKYLPAPLDEEPATETVATSGIAAHVGRPVPMLEASPAATAAAMAAATEARIGAEETKEHSNTGTPQMERRRVSCPITGQPVVDPVVAADGHTYERSAIERWFASHDTSPMTGEVLATKALFRNYSILG